MFGYDEIFEKSYFRLILRMLWPDARISFLITVIYAHIYVYIYTVLKILKIEIFKLLDEICEAFCVCAGAL
jgi:hypothetical protein